MNTFLFPPYFPLRHFFLTKKKTTETKAKKKKKKRKTEKREPLLSASLSKVEISIFF